MSTHLGVHRYSVEVGARLRRTRVNAGLDSSAEATGNFGATIASTRFFMRPLYRPPSSPTKHQQVSCLRRPSAEHRGRWAQRGRRGGARSSVCACALRLVGAKKSAGNFKCEEVVDNLHTLYNIYILILIQIQLDSLSFVWQCWHSMQLPIV